MRNLNSNDVAHWAYIDTHKFMPRRKLRCDEVLSRTAVGRETASAVLDDAHQEVQRRAPPELVHDVRRMAHGAWRSARRACVVR